MFVCVCTRPPLSTVIPRPPPNPHCPPTHRLASRKATRNAISRVWAGEALCRIATHSSVARRERKKRKIGRPSAAAAAAAHSAARALWIQASVRYRSHIPTRRYPASLRPALSPSQLSAAPPDACLPACLPTNTGIANRSSKSMNQSNAATRPPSIIPQSLSLSLSLQAARPSSEQLPPSQQTQRARNAPSRLNKLYFPLPLTRHPHALFHSRPAEAVPLLLTRRSPDAVRRR